VSELWGALATAVVTAVLLAALGAAVSRLRARRARARWRAALAGEVTDPADEFSVWTMHGPVLGRRRDRLRVRPGLVAWFDGDSTQPRWEVPAQQVVLEVRGPGRFVDVTRLVLTGPDGRRRIRVTTAPDRPLGDLDRAYERRAAEDLRAFVEAMAECGAVVRTGGVEQRP
jgi:hypothetical protein